MGSEITGTAGSDTLTGTQEDTLAGLAGDDIYMLDAFFAQIIEHADGGHDTIFSTSGFTLADGAYVEEIRAFGEVGMRLAGNAFDNIITGNTAANVLDGGAGNDTLIGGAGDDDYYMDSTFDVFIETVDGGFDSLFTRAHVTLTDSQFIEKLRAIGSAGLALAGNSHANHIIGGIGADTLTGGGGADTLVGGAGNDTYIISASTDTITELAGGGRDTIDSSVSYTLATGANIETVQVRGTAGLALTGNTSDNQIIGGIGRDTLMGGGGLDTLTGGAGNDTYVINSSYDVIIETALGGSDTVIVATAYTLATGSNLETVRIASTAGIAVQGNALANTFYSGLGKDTLTGGAGNDIYHINSASDKVVEAIGGGYDTIYSSVNYTLSDSASVSALRISGTAGLAISGNKYTNRLYSGTGADTLKGGGGADFFVFSSTAQSGPSDYDRITDFKAGTDTLNLSALDANSALAGNQAFASLGGSAKSYAVWSVKSGTSLLVYGDVTGDKIADFAVLLSNTSSIALSDIML